MPAYQNRWHRTAITNLAETPRINTLTTEQPWRSIATTGSAETPRTNTLATEHPGPECHPDADINSRCSTSTKKSWQPYCHPWPQRPPQALAPYCHPRPKRPSTDADINSRCSTSSNSGRSLQQGEQD